MQQVPYILGLDLGAASIGWALLAADDGGEPVGVLRSGVRLFEMGSVGTLDDFQRGKEESPNAARRAARQMRRQHRRKARRRQRILVLMQKYGLLPPGNARDTDARNAFFNALDAELLGQWLNRHAISNSPAEADRLSCDPDFLHVFPYRLRAEGLARPLSAHEFGRAIYQLAQRRGFLSNRRTEAEEDEELGKVKTSINGLQAEMDAAGAETLGQYLAGLAPSVSRIRGRYTSRDMLRREFDLLWERQRALHPAPYPAHLREAARNALCDAIFYQRPLKVQTNLVGFCDLEPGERRAPKYADEAQEFRLLQRLNDLVWYDKQLVPHRLADNPEHYARLRDAMLRVDSMTFPAMRKLLGLPQGSRFNLEEGGEKKLFGHRVNARMHAVFGDAWDGFSAEKRAAILHDIISMDDARALCARGRRAWGLSEEKAVQFARPLPEKGYAGHSLKALRTLLPPMRAGESYGTVRPRLYPPRYGDAPQDTLPPALDAMSTLRNPVVLRCLTELRKVVNAIVREHGKPVAIRVELARDMKRSRKERTDYSARNRKQESQREKMAERLMSPETGNARIATPRRSDVEKLLLAEECGWQCPYTGRMIGWNDLFGPHPQFDVEHILPYSRCFDDSFLNKTLCHAPENRAHKRGRTPHEAYAADPERMDAILRRVEAFQGDAATCRAKLARFRAPTMQEWEDFAARQLNDTRHASVLACKYLGLLYGPQANRHVQASRGGITAMLRGLWGLNRLLGDGGKNRGDHRHHAVDAIAVAATSRGMVQALQRAAAQAEAGRVNRLVPRDMVPLPFEGFMEQADNVVLSILPSHRVSRRVRGKLHKETLYARRELLDGAVGYAVRKRLDDVGKGKPVGPEAANTFADKLLDPGLAPSVTLLLTGSVPRRDDDDSPSPVRSARVLQTGTPVPVGKDGRLCQTASNHHAPVFAVPGKKGEEWVCPGVVSLLEAMQRKEAWKKREGGPVVDRQGPEGARFLFTLSSGECIRMRVDGQDEYLRVRSVFAEQGSLRIKSVRLADARTEKEIGTKRENGFFKLSLKQLQQGGCEKVVITPLGTVVPCRD